jgi:hypothetical protein
MYWLKRARTVKNNGLAAKKQARQLGSIARKCRPVDINPPASPSAVPVAINIRVAFAVSPVRTKLLI